MPSSCLMISWGVFLPPTIVFAASVYPLWLSLVTASILWLAIIFYWSWQKTLYYLAATVAGCLTWLGIALLAFLFDSIVVKKQQMEARSFFALLPDWMLLGTLLTMMLFVSYVLVWLILRVVINCTLYCAGRWKAANMIGGAVPESKENEALLPEGSVV